MEPSAEATALDVADIRLLSKGLIMVVLLIVLAVIAVASIVGTFSLVSRDGYGRTPKRTFVRTI